MSTQSQKPDASKQAPEELNEEEQKKVSGGSGLLSGGNDLSNVIGGTVGISNSSSGSDGTHSYSSNDSHSATLGLGNELDNLNF